MSDHPQTAPRATERTEADVRGVLARAAQRAEEEGGAEPRLRLERLSVEDREELLAATTARLQARRPSRRAAKTTSIEKEIHDWWALLLGYPDARRQQRLNPLRNEVFASLAEAEVIRRDDGGWKVAPPQGSKAGPMVDQDQLGAWVLKAKPSTWDVRRWLDEGGGPIDTWSVAHNYRAEMMAPGDVVLLWVSGNDPACPAGFRARGTVTGPCVDGTGEGPYWLDRSARRRADYFADVDLRPMDTLLPRHALQHHRTLRDMEVLRAPFASNPSFITKDQLRDLDGFGGR